MPRQRPRVIGGVGGLPPVNEPSYPGPRREAAGLQGFQAFPVMELWETPPKGDSARHPLGEEQAAGTGVVVLLITEDVSPFHPRVLSLSSRLPQ